MKKTILLAGLLFVGVALTSCGGSEESGDDSSASVKCDEKNEITVHGNAELEGVDLKYVRAVKSGASLNGTRQRKTYLVCFSNMEITNNTMYFDEAKEGQYYVIADFEGEIIEGMDNEPKEIEAGNFIPGTMFDDGNIINMKAWVGTADKWKPTMIIQNNQEDEGSAKLTHVGDGHICGTFNVKSDGLEITGSFSTPIEDDLWEKAQELKAKMKELSK